MKEHLIAVIEEEYEVHLNSKILRYDGELEDGSPVYVIIDKQKNMKEFKTAAEAAEEWLKL